MQLTPTTTLAVLAHTRSVWFESACLQSYVCAMSSVAPRGGSLTLRFAAVGAVVAALVGGVVGLIVGLNVNPRTAWFAIFEVAIPASILGGLLGLVIGALVSAVQQGDGTDRDAN